MNSFEKFGSILLVFLLFVYSCTTDNSTAPNEAGITIKAYQVGGCNGTPLAQAAYHDSCFAYTFGDTLQIDFCVFGNCCPDSARFVTNYKIKSDTIYVTVTDTAAKLCYCVCDYTIHLELSGLSGDSYVFYCDYDSVLAYREKIER